jgi:diaminopimelate decarboxylase
VDARVKRALTTIGPEVETPAYVYFEDLIHQQIDAVEQAFQDHFSISFAVKSNPNTYLLRLLASRLQHLDASSVAEIERAAVAGYSPEVVSLSGPGKRDFEIERAVELGCGEFVCESLDDFDRLQRAAARRNRRIKAVIRVNPLRLPAKFGAQMGGRPSQFGIDEEKVADLLTRLDHWPALDCIGFHVYSGSNSLNVEALAENFGIMLDLFVRLAKQHQFRPTRLIYGAGFGIPYHHGQLQLDLRTLGSLVRPLMERARREELLSAATMLLEIGRFLVAPAGFLLTRVVSVKESRGTHFAICDAGFNNHLAACGMMGSGLRRNWPIFAISTKADATPEREYTLVGPLCTSIDTLGTKVSLPNLAPGDLLAVAYSGAYGLTASPTRFISHPEPREYLVRRGIDSISVLDISEQLRVPPFGDQTLERGTGWSATTVEERCAVAGGGRSG